MFKQNKKKAPCKFMYKCDKFKTAQGCSFSHDVCKFGNTCNKLPNCQYYHPEQQQSRQNSIHKRVDKNKSPCKYGNACSNKQSGKCPYNHDIVNQSQTFDKKKNNQCKYGPSCKFLKQGICKFSHTQNNIPRIKNQPSYLDRNFHQQAISTSQFYYEPNDINDLSQKRCFKFLSNQCTEQLSCNFKHTLVSDDSVRRLLHTNINYVNEPIYDNLQVVPPKKTYSSFSYPLSCLLQIQKVPVLALLRPINNRYEKIAFFELDQKLKLLKSVSNDYGEDQYIASIFESQNKLIYRTLGDKIKIADLTKGQVSIYTMFQRQKQIIGMTTVKDSDNYKVIYANNTSIIGLNQQSNSKVILTTNIANFYTVFKKFIFSSQQIFVVGDNLGNITLLNVLQSTDFTINLSKQKSVADVSFTKLYGKPVLYVSTIDFAHNSSAVYLVDLLSFTACQVLRANEGIISKIACLYDKVFVGFNKQNIIIYETNDLGAPIGKIPICRDIITLEGYMKHGWLILIQQQGSNNGLLSICRTRKPDGFNI